MHIFAQCRSKVLQNAPREHSAILLTFIKLLFVFKAIVLYIFEWPLKTGFTVFSIYSPLAETFVVIRTFSFPSLNRLITDAL